jgi:hypothetical protein
MAEERAAERLEALRVLYEFKCCPLNEKNYWRNKLNSALDALRRGSDISREEAIMFLQKKKSYYPDYRRRRRKSEGL